MAKENGEWIMRGRELDDPLCIRSADKLIDHINKVGFLPLFANTIPGFSVEECTYGPAWWSGNIENDPWEWREIISRSGKVAYGKFFGKKSGFISLDWFSVFANYRRNGYDFDARWDDGLASYRSKRIMDCFEKQDECISSLLKEEAGFGNGGEKNFDGIIAELQMQTYLVMKDFRQKTNKQGMEYGWSLAVYAMPETLWDYDLVTSCYKEEPEASKDRIVKHMQKLYPNATYQQIIRVLK